MRKLLRFIALAFLTSGLAFAQVTVAPFLTSNPQFLDGSGNPLNAGCVFTFAAGTSTPLVTYSDSAGSTPNANPVILNSGGFPQSGGIWLTSAAYKFVVKSTGGTSCSTGSTITTTDGITWSTPSSTFAGIVSTGDITLQQSVAATSGANQSSHNHKVCGTYWTGSLSAADCWTMSVVLGSGANPTTTLQFSHSGSSGTATVNFIPALSFLNTTLTNPTLAGTVSVTGNPTVTGNVTATAGANIINAGKFNNIIYVDGVKYPMTQTGIQSAFTDACTITGAQSGTIVVIPPGNVSVSNTTGQQFLITCPLQVHMPGPSLLWFVIANTVPNTVPTFRIKPSASNQGWYVLDGGARIVGNGQFGGDAIFLDSTSGGVNHFEMRNMEIMSLDNAAWCVNMTAGAADQFFYGHISDNHLNCGIKLNSSSTGDSWLIDHNNFGSISGNTLPCIDGTTENGASHVSVFNNNGGCNGGFFISHGTTECKILYNQIEQPAFASTETNSSLIDLIGDTYSIDACEIRGNNMGSNGFVTNLIRIGTATNTIIAGNVLGIKAATGVGIVLAAASSGTKIDGTNEFIGVGGGAVAMTNATGVNPFTASFPKSDGTLPATIKNATDGGLLFCSNGGACWTLLNGGTLFSPLGAGIGLNGLSTGTTTVTAPLNAGGQFTTLDINSGPVAKAQVATDFTTANNTSLQTIGALTFTVLANAQNLSFHCSLAYSQATAAVADAFGIQVATNAPTNVIANGQVYTAAAVSTTATLATLSTTTATNIVTFTPSATATNFTATLDGTIELPASAHTVNFMVSTTAGADVITVKRGSYCQLF